MDFFVLTLQFIIFDLNFEYFFLEGCQLFLQLLLAQLVRFYSAGILLISGLVVLEFAGRFGQLGLIFVVGLSQSGVLLNQIFLLLVDLLQN